MLSSLNLYTGFTVLLSAIFQPERNNDKVIFYRTDAKINPKLSKFSDIQKILFLLFV